MRTIENMQTSIPAMINTTRAGNTGIRVKLIPIYGKTDPKSIDLDEVADYIEEVRQKYLNSKGINDKAWLMQAKKGVEEKFGIEIRNVQHDIKKFIKSYCDQNPGKTVPEIRSALLDEYPIFYGNIDSDSVFQNHLYRLGQNYEKRERGNIEYTLENYKNNLKETFPKVEALLVSGHNNSQVTLATTTSVNIVRNIRQLMLESNDYSEQQKIELQKYAATNFISLPETIMKNYLKALDVNPKFEYTFNGKVYNKRPLKYDAAVKMDNEGHYLLLECDGQFHSNDEIRNWSEEHIKEIRANDIIKNNFALENGHALQRITITKELECNSNECYRLVDYIIDNVQTSLIANGIPINKDLVEAKQEAIERTLESDFKQKYQNLPILAKVLTAKEIAEVLKTSLTNIYSHFKDYPDAQPLAHSILNIDPDKIINYLADKIESGELKNKWQTQDLIEMLDNKNIPLAEELQKREEHEVYISKHENSKNISI